MKKRSTAQFVATVLSSSWRQAAEPLQISAFELADVTPLLIQAGAGALVWRRIRDSALANGDAGAQLHQLYRLHRLEASLHLRRIKRILEQFRGAGIEPVLVKGWSVARLYPEPGLRHYFDVDLCVSHDSFTEALNLVSGMEEDSPYIDLHDELDHLDVMPWSEFFARTELIRAEGTDVRVPCAEDHLRILSVHWLRHGAWKPAGLCDVAASIESPPPDFDWQRCLGTDPVRAEWVACTIGLAQELLGAKSEEVSGKSKKQGASPLALSSSPLALRPLRFARAQRALPRWLVPAVLRQWSRSLSPSYRELALPSLLNQVTTWRELARDIYSRLDQPVRATVAMHGRFNNWPRLPYQLGELLLHAPEVPKQLAGMIREFSTPKAFDKSAQSNTMGKRVPQTIPHPERV